MRCQNPERVEHLIVMVPKAQLAERGLALDELMARRLGGTGGIARVALETMRSAWHELPDMSDDAARSLGELITQCVHLSLLELAGRGTALTQREALRDRIKQHVMRHLGDPALSVEQIAQALNCSRRHLYNAFADEPDGVAGYILARRLEACRAAFDDARLAERSITEIALATGLLEPVALQPRVPRAHRAVAQRVPAGAAASLGRGLNADSLRRERAAGTVGSVA